MASFGIFPFLARPGCFGQSLKQLYFRNLFRCVSAAQGIGSELFPEVTLQGVAIGMEPSFHCLNHQMELILRRALRPHPAVSGTLGYVRPRIRALHFRLAVHEKQSNLI